MISSVHHIIKSTSILKFLGIIVLLFICPHINGAINYSDSIFHQYIKYYNNDQNSEIIELAKSTSLFYPLSKNDSINLYQHITHNPHFETFLLLNAAIYYEKNQQTELAIHRYNELISSPKTEKEIYTYSLNTLFHLYLNNHELEKCQKICLKLLDLYSSNNDSHGLAQTYLFMGRVYMQLRNIVQAMEHLEKAYEKANKTEDTQLKLSIQSAIGATFRMDGDFLNAKKQFISIMNHPQTPINQYGSATFNMASIYLQNNKYDKAIDFLNQSLEIFSELNDSMRISNVKNNLAHIYIQQKNYPKAIENLYSVAEFAKSSNNGEMLINVYYNLLQTFINLKQPDSALIYLDKYIDLNIANWNDQQSAHILKLEKQYQFENQQRQIELLKTEDELQKARFRNIQILLIVIVVISMLFLAGGVIFYRQKQRIRKSHKLLVSRDKEIHRINVELNQSNLAKDRILSIIGHDLRGPIGSLRDLSGYYAVNPEQTEEEIQDYLKMSHESSTSLYYLLENLLAWGNSQKGSIHFSPDKIQLKPVVQQVINLLNVSLNQKNINFEVAVPTDIYVFADIQMLKTILRNLISNSIKFSTSNTRITVSAKINIDSGFAEISVEDQGIGISAEQIKSLFTEKETFFLQKSADAGGTGLGLILCKEFVEIHKGTIWACSQPQQGTKICFTLPTYIPESTEKTDRKVNEHQTPKFSHHTAREPR